LKIEEQEKVDEYQNLAREPKMHWKVNTNIILIVVGTLGTPVSVELHQQAALLETARILRKVLITG